MGEFPHIRPSIWKTWRNNSYNRRWISMNQLRWSEPVPVSEFRSAATSIEHAQPFVTVWLRNIDRLLRLIPKEESFGSLRFVDVGCGTGISTCYAAVEHNFGSLFGFDLEPLMIERARFNAQNLDLPDDGPVPSFEIQDAARYRLNNERSIAFLFNPFGKPVLQSFLENNLDMLRETRSYVAYANDKHVSTLYQYCRELMRDARYNLSLGAF